MIKPIDPVERRKFHGLEMALTCANVNLRNSFGAASDISSVAIIVGCPDSADAFDAERTAIRDDHALKKTARRVNVMHVSR